MNSIYKINKKKEYFNQIKNIITIKLNSNFFYII